MMATRTIEDRRVNRSRLAKMIDHSELHPDATRADIDRLCDEAVAYGFATVCVNPAWTAYCAKRISGSGVKVCPAIGFPLGATTTHAKVEEAREARAQGAGEIDMVINVGALKSGDARLVEDEIAAVVRVAGAAPVKTIIETCLLSRGEKVAACEIAMRAGASFVKTSTGFNGPGASVEDVRLMREVVGERLGVKAAGGIRSYAQACALIEAGASRIGTSAGVQILAEAPEAD
jgi:deoxyribose-phosphate aldolase